MQKKLYHIELDELTEITADELKAFQTIVPEARFRTKEQVLYYSSENEERWQEYCDATKKSFYVPYGCKSLELVDLNYFLSLNLDIPFTVKKITTVRFGTRHGAYTDDTYI